jgi:hypothetical protein
MKMQPDRLHVTPVVATTKDLNREANFSHILFHDDSDAKEEGGPWVQEALQAIPFPCCNPSESFGISPI